MRTFHIQIKFNSKIPRDFQGQFHFTIFDTKTLLGLRVFGKYKFKNKSEIIIVTLDVNDLHSMLNVLSIWTCVVSGAMFFHNRCFFLHHFPFPNR